MATEIEMIVEFRNMGGMDKLKPSLLNFANKIGKSMLVFYCDGDVSAQSNTDQFELCIKIYSAPEKGDEMIFSTVYGHSYEDCCILLPSRLSHEGTKVIDTNGQEVALIVENTLYILLDLASGIESDLSNAEPILKQILDDYYVNLTNQDLFAERMTERLAGQVKPFIEAFRRGLENSGRLRICDFDERIRSLETEIVEIVLNQQNEGELNQESKFRDIYNRLCDLFPDSIYWKVQRRGNNGLRFNIGQIDILFEGVVYDIGEFEVLFNCDYVSLKCINKTRRVGRRFSHPNLTEEGWCCLGDASYGLAFLLGKLKFDDVIKILLQRLNSYDPLSAYVKIEEWPVKEVVKNDSFQIE